MRLRWLVIGGAIGAVLGGGIASVRATRMFVCRDTPSLEAVCAGGFPIIAAAWGMMIGLVAGLLIGLVLSRRLAPNGDTTDRSSAQTM